jgi:hypothetical protein
LGTDGGASAFLVASTNISWAAAQATTFIIMNFVVASLRVIP